MTGPASGGVLAVDGGGQDPNDFTDWDRTQDVLDSCARNLAYAMEAIWPSIADRVDEDRRADLQERLDEFDEARRLHQAAVDRNFAARGVL